MRLLLDVHIPRQLARVLRVRGIDVYALPEWRAGELLSAPDDEILLAAYAEN